MSPALKRQKETLSLFLADNVKHILVLSRKNTLTALYKYDKLSLRIAYFWENELFSFDYSFIDRPWEMIVIRFDRTDCSSMWLF